VVLTVREVFREDDVAAERTRGFDDRRP
jgi:hypothetical protein